VRIGDAGAEKTVPESPGFQADVEPPSDGQGHRERPLSLAWITDEMVTDTQRVWSAEYGRVVTEKEAIEILMNVRRLAEVLLGAYLKGGDL